ncbi:Cytidylate kinase [Poriferisphaera corsica]|uniref:Cytidylate kinase n=1 Tax=Poriferisphaera corsica TaxID=2528020 RepID=A0A517YTP7_9BACT|nr:(d)CMP kinase [Poriferisphaera corsica]QDU33588.1 Cytidylate kinase [Poriferisphaera corsica]
MDQLIVTLDGPAGSGKSSVARFLAKRLGLEFLDTGAMYRGLTAKALHRGINPATESHAVIELARNTPMRFDWNEDPPRLYVGKLDVTDRIRDRDVTGSTSEVACLAAVRQVLVETQRRIGKEHPKLVTEGRDQGSVVFPQANVKFFLDATPTIRAKRRVLQLQEAGKRADLEQIRRDIIERDRRDSTRKEGPLICPDDAIRVDTSGMNREQVISHLENLVREKMNIPPSPDQ